MIRLTPHPHPLLPLLSLLPLLLPLLLLLSPSTLTSAATIPYTTIGPGIVSPGGIGALTAQYPLFAVPYNASSPTLHLGLTLSTNPTLPLELSIEALKFMVDLTNFRGGLSYRGQRYNLAVTYANDDQSAELVRIIYADMFASGECAMYFAPFSDGLLMALAPLLNASGPTLMSMDNQDPADFAQHYPNLFSMVNTADRTWDASLTSINEVAQSYHTTTGTGSANGISTLCLYTADETLLTAAAQGVRNWVRTENQRRGGVDNITVLVDVMWSMNLTNTYFDYIAPLLLCPDDTDVMLMMGASDSGLDVAYALADSLRRPKAAMGLSAVTQVVLTDTTQNEVAAGWIVPVPISLSDSTLGPQGGVFYSIDDAGYAFEVWKAGANTSLPLDYYEFLYLAAFQIMAAALFRTASLDAADLRAAFFELQGQTGLVIGIDFNEVTGVNQAPTSLITQANSTGSFNFDVFNNVTSIMYPYDWSWHTLQLGDTLPNSLDNTPVLIAVIIAVLGAWVASIIVEQSVFVRRKGGLWWLWLMVVAASLGGVSQWCSMLMMTSGLSIKGDNVPATPGSPGGDGSFDIEFSLAAAFVSLVPCLVLTWLGLVVLITDVEGQSLRGQSRSSQTQTILREQKEAKKKRAALSGHDHLIHLWQAISWRVVLGGMLIAVALPLTRLSLNAVWQVSAELHVGQWSWAVTTILDLALIPWCMLVYFHGSRWRVSAVFLFAGVVLQDWLVSYSSMRWTYALEESGVPSALRDARVSQEVVQLLAGIIAAGICLAFIGLQFSRMQLSRNGLSVLVASLERTTATQKEDIHRAHARNSGLRTQLDGLSRMLDFISLNSPLPTEYAFVLAFSSTFATFQSAWTASPSTAAPTSGGLTKGSLVRRPPSEQRPRLHPTSPSEASDIGQRPSKLRRHGSASVAPAPEAEAPLMKPARQQSEVPTEAFALSLSQVPGVAEGQEDTLGDAAMSGGRGKPSLVFDNQTLVLHSSQTVVSPRMGSEVGESPPALMSPTASVLAKRRVVGKEWKAYDEELLTALEQQLQWKGEHAQSQPAIPSSPTTKRSLNRANTAAAMDEDRDTSFDFAMPVLPRQALQADAAQLSQQPQPTLLSLLSHPVCLQLVKTELERIHSVENLIFFLHVQRYRMLTRASTRKALALCIYEQFVKPGAPQEINIATRQREAVAAGVLRKGEDGCGVDLFKEAEREVLMLMETNVMKSMQGTGMQRLCTWILATMPVRQIVEGVTGEAAEAADEWAQRTSLRQADPHSSNGSILEQSRHSAAIDSPGPRA